MAPQSLIVTFAMENHFSADISPTQAAIPNVF
jgi:hypothetical protein